MCWTPSGGECISSSDLYNYPRGLVSDAATSNGLRLIDFVLSFPCFAGPCELDSCEPRKI
jgi:hypothetical protein